MNRLILTLAVTTFLGTSAFSAEMTVDSINKANPLEASSSAATTRLQVLLDHASASPSIIDGKPGALTERALMAFERMNGLVPDGKLDEKSWAALTQGGKAAAKTYTLTEADVNQKLVEETPEEYKKMAKLDCLCYHRVSEAIAEKFHMDEDFLKTLNPDADFSKAGTKLIVTNVGGISDQEVARIEIDKEANELLGYDAEDKLVFFAHASVGSDQTPSPSGTVEVRAIATDPTYTVNAKKNLGGESDEKFNIAAGPNGPVGSMWIDLSKPTFGIHGTPYPSEISRTASHGCVRLTNWDANELGRIVKVGAKVEFKN